MKYLGIFPEIATDMWGYDWEEIAIGENNVLYDKKNSCYAIGFKDGTYKSYICVIVSPNDKAEELIPLINQLRIDIETSQMLLYEKEATLKSLVSINGINPSGFPSDSTRRKHYTAKLQLYSNKNETEWFLALNDKALCGFSNEKSAHKVFTIVEECLSNTVHNICRLFRRA